MPAVEEQGLLRLSEEFQAGALTYDEVKRRYAELGDQIRQQYEREVTVLSLDVVHSRRAKSGASVLDSQLTFDAYHRIVEQTLVSHGCRSFQWAGDGLTAVFRPAEAAVQTALAVLEMLPQFNTYYNRLGHPFELRAGAHAGAILPGEETGKVSSTTFDIAGHLQKAAAPGQILISEACLRQLSESAIRFSRAPNYVTGVSACFAFPQGADSRAMPSPHAPPVSFSPALAGELGTWPSRPPAEHENSCRTEPRRSDPAPLFWTLGGIGAGVAIVLLVLVVISLTRPTTAPDPIVPVTVRTAPARRAHVDSALPASPTRTPGANGVQAQLATAPRHITPPAVTRAAGEPWEPTRTLWRSPAATSGIPPQLAPSPPDRKWVLCIGARGGLEGGWDASGPAQSARIVAQALHLAGGVPREHVQVLPDRQATPKNVRRAFRELQLAASSGTDTVYVYLAGNGQLAPDRAGFRHESGVGFLLEADEAGDGQEAGIYGVDLAQWLAGVRAQTIVLFLDAAYSGGVDLPTLPDPGRQYAVLAAAAATDRVLYRPPDGNRSASSAFADALAAGLAGQADGDRDQRVSLHELAVHLTTTVSRRTGGVQTPQVLCGFGGFLPEHYFATSARNGR